MASGLPDFNSANQPTVPTYRTGTSYYWWNEQVVVPALTALGGGMWVTPAGYYTFFTYVSCSCESSNMQEFQLIEPASTITAKYFNEHGFTGSANGFYRLAPLQAVTRVLTNYDVVPRTFWFNVYAYVIRI